MASSSTTTAAAGTLLKRQLKQMQSAKDLPGISCGLVNDSNIFEWEVMLMISDDCKYYGGELCHHRQHSPAPPSYLN
jgi:ubiquitin-conjugating enzyme E2 G1